MTDKPKNDNYSPESTQPIEDLQRQLSQAKLIIDKQKQQNKQLQEKMILQEQLNSQLSNFHLTTCFQNKENQVVSVKNGDDLVKANEHIMLLGNMLLKNKITIQKLKKHKLKDDTMCNQLAELIKEKNSLLDIVLKVHEHLTGKPLLDGELVEDKVSDVIAILQKNGKKIRP